MDFTIDTYELQRIAKTLGQVARNTNDRSGKITIKAKDNNEVVFLATRDSIGIQVVSTKAHVIEPGVLTTPYSHIKSFIFSFFPWSGNYGTKEFHITSKNDETFIQVTTVYEDGKESKGKLKLTTDSTYTVIAPEPVTKPSFILNSNIIRDAVNKVIYAIDPTVSKPVIRGMNIAFDDKYIYFAGTNGRMLSEYKVNNVSDLKSGSFVVAYDFISVLKSIITEDSQLFFEVDLKNYDPKIKVAFDNVYYWGSQLVGHEYPDYNPLLTGFSETVVVKKHALTSLLHPLMDVLNPEDHHRVTLRLDHNNMVLSNDSGIFEYAGDVNFNGKFIIDLNGIFLNQTIEAIKDDDIKLKFSADDKVFIFDSNNFENQLALVTPIKRR